MSVYAFRQRLQSAELSERDLKWMPIWLERYASFTAQPLDAPLQLTKEQTLLFLRRLRDSHVAAWQRLQAARALEWYQSVILPTPNVDFESFQRKLSENVF